MRLNEFVELLEEHQPDAVVMPRDELNQLRRDLEKSSGRLVDPSKMTYPHSMFGVPVFLEETE